MGWREERCKGGREKGRKERSEEQRWREVGGRKVERYREGKVGEEGTKLMP